MHFYRLDVAFAEYTERKGHVLFKTDGCPAAILIISGVVEWFQTVPPDITPEQIQARVVDAKRFPSDVNNEAFEKLKESQHGNH